MPATNSKRHDWTRSPNASPSSGLDAGVTAVRDAPLPFRGVGMMVHVDSKPLAPPFSYLVVGTAQGDVDHRGQSLCAHADYYDRHLRNG